MEQSMQRVVHSNVTLVLARLSIFVKHAILSLPMAFLVMMAITILMMPSLLHGFSGMTTAQFIAQWRQLHLHLFGQLYQLSIILRSLFLISWLVALVGRLFVCDWFYQQQ